MNRNTQICVVDWKTGKVTLEFYRFECLADIVEGCQLMNFQNERMIGTLGEFERFYFIS